MKYVFQVAPPETGECDANPNHVDRLVVEVEDLATKQTLRFCQKCLWSQLILKGKGRNAEVRVASQG